MRVSDILFVIASLSLISVSTAFRAQAMPECNAQHQAGTLANELRESFSSSADKNEICDATGLFMQEADEEKTSSINRGERLSEAAQIGKENIIFPSAIFQRYSKESFGTARLLTCLDQYRTNQMNGSNGDLKWFGRDGGYFEECKSRLSGR